MNVFLKQILCKIKASQKHHFVLKTHRSLGYFSVFLYVFHKMKRWKGWYKGKTLYVESFISWKSSLVD